MSRPNKKDQGTDENIYEEKDLIEDQSHDVSRIKAAKEIIALQNKDRSDTKRYWMDWARLAFIAVLSAGITFWSTSVFKESDRVNSEKRREQDARIAADEGMVDRFQNTELELDKATDTLVIMKLFDRLCNLKLPEATELRDQRDAYCQKHVELAALVQGRRNVNSGLADGTMAHAPEIELAEKVQLRLRERNQLDITPEQKRVLADSLAMATARLDTLTSKYHLNAAVEAVSTIDEAVKGLHAGGEALNKSKGIATGTRSAVSWFKEGYFLVFNDQRRARKYKILLENIDRPNGMIKVIVSRYGQDGRSTSIVATLPIERGSYAEFVDLGVSYRIHLETIDHAGKNPFTWAAYVSFETPK